MALYCKLVGHTFVVHTENKKISWNTAKSLSELEITSDGEDPKTWLECRRCGHKIENPSSADIKLAGCNVRRA